VSSPGTKRTVTETKIDGFERLLYPRKQTLGEL